MIHFVLHELCHQKRCAAPVVLYSFGIQNATHRMFFRTHLTKRFFRFLYSITETPAGHILIIESKTIKLQPALVCLELGLSYYLLVFNIKLVLHDLSSLQDFSAVPQRRPGSLFFRTKIPIVMSIAD
jgi:hypothetical protein